jgi:aspartate aminotransferase
MNPSRIAQRIARIKPSPSAAAAADRARELRAQGKSIVGLVLGEPSENRRQVNSGVIAVEMD